MGIYRHKPTLDTSVLDDKQPPTVQENYKTASAGSVEREMALAATLEKQGHKDPEVKAHVALMLG